MSFVYAQKVNKIPNVLILFASQPNTPAYNRITNGITDRFTESYGDSINVYIEYLDKELLPSGEYPKEKFDLINVKYSNSNIDILICVGVNVIDLIKPHAADYLLKLPAVSLDLDFSSFGYFSNLSLNKQTAEIKLKLNIEKSVKEALALFPLTESVYFIGGVSNFDKMMLSFSKQVADRILKNKSVHFITDLPMDEVAARIKNLPDNSIAIMSNFNMDQKKVLYHNPEAVRILSRNAKAPLFIYTSTGFGDGSIGGYILDFEKAGWVSGDAAVKILNGTDPNSIKVNESDYYQYLYDWRVLKRWKIENSNLLHDGSTILFREVSLLDEYKWIIGAALLFIVLQSSLIVNLIRLNKNQKVLTKQLIEYQNKYRDFLHVDRSLRVGQLTASLSHELNQPLTAILSTAQAGINFINSNEYTPELLKQILQKIVDNDKRTASILNSIRGMLKLESREKEKVNLTFLINDILEVYKSETVLYNIELNSNLPFDHVYVMADPIQLEQVILNFLINSSQSLKKYSIKKKTITVSLSKNENDAIVSVEDNGTGIDPDIKAKLFQPFTTTKIEGMGIGLAICRTIIEDHNGKIWADNLPGGGAIFSFSIGIYRDE